MPLAEGNPLPAVESEAERGAGLSRDSAGNQQATEGAEEWVGKDRRRCWVRCACWSTVMSVAGTPTHHEGKRACACVGSYTW